MTYSEKLKDPRWQKKRLEVLERDEFTCCMCGDKETTLHVHHLKYKGDPWQVNIKYLQTICEECHKLTHMVLKNHKPDQVLNVSKRKWGRDFYGHDVSYTWGYVEYDENYEERMVLDIYQVLDILKGYKDFNIKDAK